MYLSFEHMRGNLDKLQLQKELSIVKEAIRTEKEPHLDEFLSSWKE